MSVWSNSLFERLLPGKADILRARMGHPLELEEGVPSTVFNHILTTISLLMLALLVWAFFGTIREVAQTTGEIVPAGDVQLIEHLEGGTVDALLVREGDHVPRGAPLIRLSQSATQSELERVNLRIRWLEQEERRLEFQQEGGEGFQLRLSGSFSDFDEPQRTALNAHLESQSSERAALAARLAQKEAEVESLDAQIRMQADQIALEHDKLRIQEELMKSGYTSKRRFLEAKSEYQQALMRQAQLKGDVSEARQLAEEARAGLRQAIADNRLTFADERSRLTQERAELQKEAERLQDRYERLYVRSTVDGYVKNLVPPGAGAVIKPGSLVAEIVPAGGDMLAEVRIDPRDIGHIGIGDQADISITSYDPAVQGTITGTLRTISASSFQDEAGTYFFKGTIAFSGNTIGSGTSERPVSPGMQVNAKIVTGSKSIMRYLLKPIYRSMGNAFSER